MDQLSWVKWRTGMILQYGNLRLLSVSELDKGLFPGVTGLQGIRILLDGKWRPHKPDVEIFGINIEVWRDASWRHQIYIKTGNSQHTVFA